MRKLQRIIFELEAPNGATMSVWVTHMDDSSINWLRSQGPRLRLREIVYEEATQTKRTVLS